MPVPCWTAAVKVWNRVQNVSMVIVSRQYNFPRVTDDMYCMPCLQTALTINTLNHVDVSSPMLLHCMITEIVLTDEIAETTTSVSCNDICKSP